MHLRGSRILRAHNPLGQRSHYTSDIQIPQALTSSLIGVCVFEAQRGHICLGCCVFEADGQLMASNFRESKRPPSTCIQIFAYLRFKTRPMSFLQGVFEVNFKFVLVIAAACQPQQTLTYFFLPCWLLLVSNKYNPGPWPGRLGPSEVLDVLCFSAGVVFFIEKIGAIRFLLRSEYMERARRAWKG